MTFCEEIPNKMELNWLLFTFIVLYVGQIAFNVWVERANTAYSEKHGDSVPAGFEGFIDAAGLDRMNAYTRGKSRFGTIEEIATEAVFLVILLSGFLPLIGRWSERFGFSLIPAGLFFFFVPGFIQFMVELPFGYYHAFVLEEKFGFNRSTLKLWIIDHIKGGLISIVLFAALLSALLLIIVYSPQHWWIWGFLIVSGVQVLMAILYPVLIAPLFNKFEPVRDEELASRIMALMQENGIRVKKILQMNAGLRSRHTNAYFTGIGKTKQIVLFDTLIESHTVEEILAVLAHEAGHFRKKHVLKQLLIFECFSLAGFYATWLFMKWQTLYQTFGFGSPLPYVGLFLAGIFWQKAGFFLQPLYMALSRRFEREADAFALNMVKTAIPMMHALKRLAADNLSNLNPHPLYVWFHYSHPPIIERVAALAEAQRHFEGSTAACCPERPGV